MASQPKQRLVVVGNGMAPGRALERLFETNPDAYEVTIFNAEPRVNYDRIMLSPVLSGEKSFEEIVIHGDGWYVKHGVPPGLSWMLFRRTNESDSFGLVGESIAITLRYNLCVLPGAESQVYSTYTMLPSPLISPNIFNTVAVDPPAYPV